jgi:hypothetical protein
LQRHLHGDFDRHRPGLGEEHPVHAHRHQPRKPPGERKRALMDQPAEHDMRHDFELAPHRRRDVGMIVAVACGPPRRDAIHEFAAVGKDDAAAAGSHDRERFAGDLHLRIGQPDVRKSGIEPRRPDRGVMRGGRGIG